MNTCVSQERTWDSIVKLRCQGRTILAHGPRGYSERTLHQGVRRDISKTLTLSVWRHGKLALAREWRHIRSQPSLRELTYWEVEQSRTRSCANGYDSGCHCFVERSCGMHSLQYDTLSFHALFHACFTPSASEPRRYASDSCVDGHPTAELFMDFATVLPTVTHHVTHLFKQK